VGQTSYASVPNAAATPGLIVGAGLDDAVWVTLHANLPLVSDGTPWAAAALGTRLGGSGRVAPGLDLAASGYGYSDRVTIGEGGGATLVALPLLAFGTGPWRAEFRSGVMHHAETFAGASSGRTVHHSDARLGVHAGALRVGSELRWVRAAEGDHPYAGADASLSAGAVTLHAHAGRWLSDTFDGTALEVTATIPAGAATELTGSFRRVADDPLFLAGERTGWSVGVSRRLGVRPGSGAGPRVAAAGRVTFTVPRSASPTAPAVAGDFNGWTPVPLAAVGEAWAVTLAVPPGVHRYAYRAADGRWFVPAGVPGRVDDGFGGVSAVLVVP
jgi:hypothetical protein